MKSLTTKKQNSPTLSKKKSNSHSRTHKNAHKNKNSHPNFHHSFVVLLLILLLFTLISLFIGTQKISPLIFFTNFPSLDPFDKIILFELRLPRILLSILCGALLAGSGAVFQGFFRNPLADSGILGISSGATFGAVLAIFFSQTVTSFLTFKFLSPISLFAFLGGIFTSFLILSLSFTFKTSSSITLLLSGTAVGTFLSSLSSLFLILKQRDLHTVYAWTMGSFNGKNWEDLFLFLIPSIISLILLNFCSKNLNLLGSGEKTAVTLGLNLTFTKFFTLIVGSLATSCAVCMGGIISFVGLICPHIIRNIFGSEHKIVIPFSMILGAILLLLSDTLARILISPSEIPVGIITSLLGVPFFIIVLKKSQVQGEF